MMPRLSLLSKGTGEIRQTSSQRINVTLDPKEFSPLQRRLHTSILKSDVSFLSSTSYMPPPGFYQSRHPRIKPEATLPKTFSTKKGALVLYSEEFARLHRPSDMIHDEYDVERQQLNIRTTDLTLAISRFEESQNKYNRFMRRDNVPEIKPGHSARRHAAAWHLAHPEVNLRGALGSRFARKPDRRGRKKRIVRTSLTVFPPPYNLPKSLSQIRNGPPVSGGILKDRTSNSLRTTTMQSPRARTFMSLQSPPRKLVPLENSLARKEWTKPLTPKVDRDTDNLSSASSGIKFTRNRLPPIFKHPSSGGTKVIKEGASSQNSSSTSSSIRKKVRIQLDPVVLPDPYSPGHYSTPT